ncbi:DUF2846 domain-containing protein [Bradyrhizobium sp.]|uniref:DUF2846 domain-containing protein n=1 Tax=Bradyrhizobium sp. TaxID=376 RepID=UPI003C3588EE
MGPLDRIVIAVGSALQRAACAGTSALESQSKQRDARLARIYFSREKAIVGTTGGTAVSAEIKVDGRNVGSVSNGSCFFIDRSPGLYRLSVGNALSIAFEAELRVEGGQNDYLGIGSPETGAAGRDFADVALAGGSGTDEEPIPLSNALSGAAFFRLDPSTGAATIAELKDPER